MEPFYRPLLKRALSVTWKNKWLWVLGFLAAFLGNSSVYEAMVRSLNNLNEGKTVYHTMLEYSQSGFFGMLSWNNLAVAWQTDFSGFVGSLFILLFILLILAIFLSLAIIGQGAVIRGVVDLDQKHKTDLKKSWHIGLEKFWPILEVNFITKFVLLGLLVLLAFIISILFSGGTLWQMLIYIPSVVLFIVLTIIVNFLTIYGTAYVVLRRKKAFAALRAAWDIFRQNTLLNLEVGLLLFVINIIFLALLGLGMLIVVAPLIILYFLFNLAGSLVLAWITGILMVVLVVALMVMVGSAYNTFRIAVWAILFEELALNSGRSKLHRTYDKIKSHLKKHNKKKSPKKKK